MKSNRSLPVIVFISILLASPWFFATSVYAANSQCSSSFTDGLQIHSAGGVLSFAHEATLKNSPTNILTTPTIVATGGDPTCGNVNCTATGTSSVQMNPGPYETQTGGLNLFIRKKKRATIGAAGIVNYNRIAVGTKARLKTTASETTYWISSLMTQKKAVLNLTPGTYWIDSLHLGQKTKLNIIGAGTVRIISRNTMVFDKDVQLNVKGAANQNLILYSYGNITVQKKTKIKALLYAQGTIIINKEAKIIGALSATNIILKSDASITYAPTAVSTADFGTLCNATASINHFLISHDGQGINCLAEPITVAAHALNHSLVTTYNGTIILNTGTAKGSWTLASGNGVFIDAIANDGLASYQFSPADNGTVQFNLHYLEGSSPINIGVSSAGIVDDNTEGLLNFSPSGFTITATPLSNPPPNPINDPVLSQTAATIFNLAITAYGQTPTDPQCGVIESYNGIKPLNFWLNYNNPTTGTRTATINTQPIATTEAVSVAQNVTFVSGQSTVTTKYKDVGSIQIALKDADLAAHANIIRGSSNNFVVKPADFITVLSGNPAATNANGALFKKAGESFPVQVKVVDAEGTVTPNYGKEIVAETIKLKSAQLIAPIGGRNGADGLGTLVNGNNFVASTPGQFQNNNVAFDEVGIIRLQAAVGDGDYLGAGNVVGIKTANVGRFAPDRFQLSSNNPAFKNGDAGWGCSFSYQQQPFSFAIGLNPVLTLTALSKQGTPTFNYGGNFWKFNSSLSNRSYVNQTAGIAAILIVDKTASTVTVTGNLDYIDGKGTLTITGDLLSYNKVAAIPAANDAPFNALASLSIPVNDLKDSDGICLDANNDGICETYNSANISGTQIRWGRWLMENAAGNELENLNIVAVAQYFDGNFFQLNIADVCSSTTTSWLAPTLSSYTANLSAGKTILSQSAMATGILPLLLSAPGEGNDGSLLITIPTPAWMFYDFDGNGTPDASSATATFGVYKGKKPVIYWRQKFGN